MNPSTGEVQEDSVPFYLPHEVIEAARRENPGRLKTHDQKGLDKKDKDHLHMVEEALSVAQGSVLAVGLWMDGVACKWDRSQSLDMVVMSFPGWSEEWGNVRIPSTGTLSSSIHSMISWR